MTNERKRYKKKNNKKKDSTVSVTCARHNRHTRHRVIVNSGSSLVEVVVVVKLAYIDFLSFWAMAAAKLPTRQMIIT